MEHTRATYLEFKKLQQILGEVTYKYSNYCEFYQMHYKGIAYIGLCPLAALVDKFMLGGGIRLYLKYRLWGNSYEKKANCMRWKVNTPAGFTHRKKFVDKIVKELEAYYES